MSLIFLALGVAGMAAVGTWPEKTTEFQLANGLRVVVLERTSSAVSFTLLAKAGWADDPVGRRGLSRLMEQMVQEGGYAYGSRNLAEERKALADAEALADKWEAESNKPQKDELLESRLRVDAEAAYARVTTMAEAATFRRQIENAGGLLPQPKADATTTAIAATLPSEQAEVWFNGISAWLRDPAWRNFYRHRLDAVNATGRASEETILLNALAAKAFPKHAWGMPDADVAEFQKCRIRDLAAFHRVAFAPGNLVLAVVGNMPASEVRALAEKHLASLATQPPMAHKWDGREEKPFTLPAARPGVQALAIGYPRSQLDSPDDVVLDVISYLLTSGPDSYLPSKLVQTRKAGSITGSTSHPSTSGGGLLTVIGLPIPSSSLEELEKLIQAAIADFAAEPLSPTALLPGKRHFTATTVRLLESSSSAADLLARYVAFAGTFKALTKNLQDVEAVTPADVQRVAKKYLTAESKTSVTWIGARQ